MTDRAQAERPGRVSRPPQLALVHQAQELIGFPGERGARRSQRHLRPCVLQIGVGSIAVTLRRERQRGYTADEVSVTSAWRHASRNFDSAAAASADLC